ncbi:actin [Pelomyxa schiedti]|nr:actin [Pelomyxa schiedti]
MTTDAGEKRPQNVVFHIGARNIRCGIYDEEAEEKKVFVISTRLCRIWRQPFMSFLCGTHVRAGASSLVRQLPALALENIASLLRLDRMWVPQVQIMGETNTPVEPSTSYTSSHRDDILETKNVIGIGGNIPNWQHLRIILEEAFSRMEVDPHGCEVLVVEPVQVNPDFRAGLSEIFIDYLGAHSLSVVQSPLYLHWLYEGACQRVWRLFVRIGESSCHAEPLRMEEDDGTDSLYHAVPRGVCLENTIGGRHITLQLMHLLGLPNDDTAWSADYETINEAKNRLCYIAQDPENELNNTANSENCTLHLPSGKTVTITKEMKFKSAEVLFKPALAGRTGLGLHELLTDVFNRLGGSWWWFMRNIILVGGTAQITGLVERLTRELTKLFPAKAARVGSYQGPTTSIYEGAYCLLHWHLTPDGGLLVKLHPRIYVDGSKTRKLVGTCPICHRPILSVATTCKAGYLLLHLTCYKCSTCNKQLGHMYLNHGVDVSQASEGLIYCPDHSPSRSINLNYSNNSLTPPLIGIPRSLCVVCKKPVHKMEMAKLAVTCHRSCAKCQTCNTYLRADSCIHAPLLGLLFCPAHTPKS